ncbi:MAG: glycosyltransferase, partial [Planctomycetota bacterium]
WNFKETVARLLERDAAIAIQNGDELHAKVLELLGDETLREKLGAAARAFVRSQQGATTRTLEALESLLPGTDNVQEAA